MWGIFSCMHFFPWKNMCKRRNPEEWATQDDGKEWNLTRFPSHIQTFISLTQHDGTMLVRSAKKVFLDICESNVIFLFPLFSPAFFGALITRLSMKQIAQGRKEEEDGKICFPLSPCWRITWTLLTSQTKQSTTQKQDRKYMETLLHPSKTTFSKYTLFEFPELANASIANCALYLRPCTYV